MSEKWKVRESLVRLFKDALARGNVDLASVYGDSAIRLGAEELARLFDELRPRAR
jgi:hypothetical protein